MHYSVELWDSYNKVENNLLFHLRGLKDFIYLIKELNKSTKLFSNNLKKLYEMKMSITTNESLSVGIENFRKNLFCQYNFLEKYIGEITSEIIDPLDILQESMLKKLNENYKDTINAEKNYNSYITQIDFTRNKFHSRVKQLEQKMLDLEKEKFKKDLDQNAIKKLEDEKKSYIGYAKDSEKMYLSYIKYTNRIQDDFIEIKKKNFNEIQNLEIELGEKIKDSLNKYYTFQTDYLKILKLEVEENLKLLCEIDINSDINTYINNNKTDDIPPFHFEYVPYICNLDKQNINLNINDEDSKKIIIKVKEEIKALFPKEKDVSILRTKTDKEVQNFINSILSGEKEKIINGNEENLKIISNKNLRRLFLIYLNNLRNNVHIILDDISYKIIGDLLKECLYNSYKEKDMLNIKLIMNISTNLFKINKISNKPRNFLYNYFIKYPIWKEFKFWQNKIKYDIIEEMHNQKKCNLFIDENDTLKSVRIKGIVEKQLYSNLYNMISFEVNTSLMNKIINYFSNFYKLEKHNIESLNKIINNYKSNKIELKERKKLSNSFDLSLMNKNIDVNFTDNNIMKNNILNKNNIVEPVIQDEQKINDCFEEIDIKNNKINLFNKKLKYHENLIDKENKIQNKNESEEEVENSDDYGE